MKAGSSSGRATFSNSERVIGKKKVLAGLFWCAGSDMGDMIYKYYFKKKNKISNIMYRGSDMGV